MYPKYFSFQGGDLNSPHFFREKKERKMKEEKTLTAKTAV